MGLYLQSFLYTPVDSGWSSEVSNNVHAIINYSYFNLIIVFIHAKKPNMVNYTTGIYNNCTSQGVKTGLSKKYCG